MDTLLDNNRLSLDNPRFAEAVGRMTRLLNSNPSYYNEWRAIAASSADKAFRAKINAAADVANNKYKEARLGLEREKLSMNKVNTGRALDLKADELELESEWKPQAVLGGIDILSKGYFGGKEAERKRAQAAKLDLLNERLFGKGV